MKMSSVSQQEEKWQKILKMAKNPKIPSAEHASNVKPLLDAFGLPGVQTAHYTSFIN